MPKGERELQAQAALAPGCSLIALADRALYRAKRDGKNRVVATGRGGVAASRSDRGLSRAPIPDGERD